MSAFRFFSSPRQPTPVRHPRRFSFETLEPRLVLSITLLSDDFQADAVDAQPASADLFLNASGPDGFIQIAGAGGTYSDPFGPATNKSLVIDNPGAAQPVVGWNSIFSDDPADFRDGTISFDLYMPEPSGQTWTYFDFRLGYGGVGRTAPTTVSDTTVWNTFRVNTSSPDIVFDNGSGAGLAAITSGTSLAIRYDIDGTNETYRLSIDGAPVNFGIGNPDRPWIAGATGINMFGFFGAFPLTSAPVSIDNLVIVNDTMPIDPPTPWEPPAGEPTDLLQWYQHRGNKRLTGEATINQDIVSGAGVLWSEYVGSRESWTAVGPDVGNQNVALPTSNISISQSELISWDLNGPYFDLGGTGTLTAESTHSGKRIGDFIPGNGVLEKLEIEVFDTTFGQGVVRLFTYSGGTWVQQWESAEIPSMFGIPNLITGDFDNDGNQEVALTPWYDVYVLDMATGQTEDTVRFKPDSNQSGRPYGWLGAYDVTGDDREEIFAIGDFQDFISVQTWNGSGDLVNLWEHVFDPRLSSKQTIHRPMAFPIRDITGNGQLNIATTVFNETGDNRWHVLIFDAATGSVLHDLPDHAIDGARDVDGDGDYELFVRQTQGSLLSETATVKILDWNGNGFDTLWSLDNTSFVTQDISDFPLHVNSATSTGKLDLLTGTLQPGGQEHFFTRSIVDPSTNEARVDIWQLDGLGGVHGAGSASGLNLDALAVRETADSAASILLSAEVVGDTIQLDADFDADRDRDGLDFMAWQRGFGITSGATVSDGDANGDEKVDDQDLDIWKQNYAKSDPNRLQLNTLNGSPVYSQGGSPPRSSVVVGRLGGPGDDPTVILQGGSETIVALQPQINGSVKPAWTRAGLGAFFGATQNQGQHDSSGVALGDLNGDSDLETLYATSGEAGQARLVAANPDGTELWHADFDVPGGKRVFNQPGLVLWRTGNFTSNLYEDVLVQIIRGIGGTGEFYMLDGQTGQTLWTRDYGNTPGSSPIQRGAGEAHMAVYDWDGDGLDEAVNFNPDMFYVVDGDGTNLIDKSVFNGGVFPGGSPLFGAPIVADFLGNQTDSILFAGSYAQLGLVDKNAVPVWNTPFIFDNTPGFIQGIGDVDNDGDLDILSPGHPITPGVDTTSLFYAYDAATGQLLWQVNLPGRAHAPVGGAYFDTPTLSVSADIDNDGRVESVFAIADTLYAVGADPSGMSGQIEWSFKPDSGLLGSPIIADGNGDGLAEIIVVSTSGFVYGIGAVPGSLAAASPVAASMATYGVAGSNDMSISEPMLAAEMANGSPRKLAAQLLLGRDGSHDKFALVRPRGSDRNDPWTRLPEQQEVRWGRRASSDNTRIISLRHSVAVETLFRERGEAGMAGHPRDQGATTISEWFPITSGLTELKSTDLLFAEIAEGAWKVL